MPPPFRLAPDFVSNEEAAPTDTEPKMVMGRLARLVMPHEIAEACENAPAIPDISDFLKWWPSLLSNPHQLLKDLPTRIFAFAKSPPDGFGLRVGRAVLATWHLREINRGRPSSPWDDLGIFALDVISNAVALWTLFACPVCGRKLFHHGFQNMSDLRTTRQHREADEMAGFQIEPKTLRVFDCGVSIGTPAWFEHTRVLSYPHDPATCKEARSAAQDAAREFMWRCLKKQYQDDDPSCVVPNCVSEFFRNAVRKGKLAKHSPGNQGGEVIRDGTQAILRGFDRAAKRGISGAGPGMLLHKSEFVFAVA